MNPADPNLPLLESVAHALGPLCDRFVFVGGCMLDVMPTDESVLGFGNRWYDVAVRTAEPVLLPSGRSIRLIAPPVFLATKLEAFHGRGGGDFLASHDLEDIAVVIDGRPELVDEVATCEAALRTYLADEIEALLRERGRRGVVSLRSFTLGQQNRARGMKRCPGRLVTSAALNTPVPTNRSARPFRLS